MFEPRLFLLCHRESRPLASETVKDVTGDVYLFKVSPSEPQVRSSHQSEMKVSLLSKKQLFKI